MGPTGQMVNSNDNNPSAEEGSMRTTPQLLVVPLVSFLK